MPTEGVIWKIVLVLALVALFGIVSQFLVTAAPFFARATTSFRAVPVDETHGTSPAYAEVPAWWWSQGVRAIMGVDASAFRSLVFDSGLMVMLAALVFFLVRQVFGG